jgi:hypothetical protein
MSGENLKVEYESAPRGRPVGTRDILASVVVMSIVGGFGGLASLGMIGMIVGIPCSLYTSSKEPVVVCSLSGIAFGAVAGALSGFIRALLLPMRSEIKARRITIGIVTVLVVVPPLIALYVDHEPGNIEAGTIYFVASIPAVLIATLSAWKAAGEFKPNSE